jgi:hypothetical protein
MPPCGDDPNGGDDTADDSLSDTKRDLLRIIDVADEGTATELTIQKVAFQLVRDRDIDSLKPFSIYIGGVNSIKIKKTLCQMGEEGLIRTRPSASDKVDADSYCLTDKGREVLDEVGKNPEFSEVYERFRARYGRTSNWWAHTDTICSWISNELNCVATDPDLHKALRKQACSTGEVDELIKKCLRSSRPAAVQDHDSEAADIIHLALRLIEDNKWIPAERDEKEEAYNQYVDNRTRFSIRNILNKADSNLEKRVVLLKGYADSIQLSGQKFELKEDPLSSSPSILVEFSGEWEATPGEILNKYSIGVVGYVSEKEGSDPVIRALAIIKSNPLPQKLRHSPQRDLKTINKKQRQRVGDLVKHGQDLLESTDDEVRAQAEDGEEIIDKIREFLIKISPEDELDEPIRWWLNRLKTRLRRSSDDLMRIAFWIEALKRTAEYWPHLFK